MQAKHNAANKMIKKIKETAESGGDLNEVPLKTLLNCSSW